MEVLRYEISVCEGAMGHVHGAYYKIVEIHVPELSLCVNKEASFISDGSRIPQGAAIEKIEVDAATAGVLAEMADTKRRLIQCEEIIGKYFELENE